MQPDPSWRMPSERNYRDDMGYTLPTQRGVEHLISSSRTMRAWPIWKLTSGKQEGCCSIIWTSSKPAGWQPRRPWMPLCGKPLLPGSTGLWPSRCSKREALFVKRSAGWKIPTVSRCGLPSRETKRTFLITKRAICRRTAVAKAHGKWPTGLFYWPSAANFPRKSGCCLTPMPS